MNVRSESQFTKCVILPSNSKHPWQSPFLPCGDATRHPLIHLFEIILVITRLHRPRPVCGVQVLLGSWKSNVNNDTEENTWQMCIFLAGYSLSTPVWTHARVWEPYDAKAHFICELCECQDENAVVCPPLPPSIPCSLVPGKVTV